MEIKTRRKIKKSSSAEQALETAKKLEIAIDYPREGEPIWTGHYAIRCSGTPNAEVEISLNNGPWQACRPSVGFYWFDWWADATTPNELTARIRVGNSGWQKTKSRQVKAAAPQKN